MLTLVDDIYIMPDIGKIIDVWHDVYEDLYRADGTKVHVQTGRETIKTTIDKNTWLEYQYYRTTMLPMMWDNKVYQYYFLKESDVSYDSYIDDAISLLSGSVLPRWANENYNCISLDNNWDYEMHTYYPTADFSVFPFLELVCRGRGESYWRIVPPRRALTCKWSKSYPEYFHIQHNFVSSPYRSEYTSISKQTDRFDTDDKKVALMIQRLGKYVELDMYQIEDMVIDFLRTKRRKS